MMKTFSDRLKAFRIKSGLMQREMAGKLDMPANTYNGYETGKRIPSMDVVSQIADLLDISIDYLMGKTDNPYTVAWVNEQIPKELKEVGIEYMTLAKEMQEAELSPDEIRKIIEAVKNIKNQK